MGSDWKAILITALVSAAVAIVTAEVRERSKERRARDYRWDQAQYELTKDFIANSRLLRHLCGRYGQASDQTDAFAEISKVHGQVRSVQQELRIVANEDCNNKARIVLKHLYAIYRTKVLGDPDQRSAQYPDKPPEARYELAVRDFLIASRLQLRVQGASRVDADLGLPDDPWSKQP
ncbi:hypothetical protein ACFWE3_15500 [Mycobacteriaceae bacterium NPDC060252]